MKPKLIISAWNNRSESTYHFGPFPSQKAAETFRDKLPGYYCDFWLFWLNHPNLAGTGQEVS